MVTTEMSEATPIVENGGEVREVAVEIEILCVGPTADPSIELMTLNVTNPSSHQKNQGQNFNRVSKRVTKYVRTFVILFSVFQFTCKTFATHQTK